MSSRAGICKKLPHGISSVLYEGQRCIIYEDSSGYNSVITDGHYPICNINTDMVDEFFDIYFNKEEILDIIISFLNLDSSCYFVTKDLDINEEEYNSVIDTIFINYNKFTIKIGLKENWAYNFCVIEKINMQIICNKNIVLHGYMTFDATKKQISKMCDIIKLICDN